MKISIVIPAYHEEKRIRKTLGRLVSYLNKQPFSYEIIAVDDGSRDQTHTILLEAAKEFSVLKIIRNEINHGKGYAVRQGILAARGGLIFFTDADLSTPPQEILKFAKIFEEKSADVLIGSRHVGGSEILISQPWHRRLMGRAFNIFVKLITQLPFEDTQCGFKAFRRSVAQHIFSEAKQDGFNFDIETLLIAQKLGYQVLEVPIKWADDQDSKVSAIQDSLCMFTDLWKLRQEYFGRRN